INFDRVIVQSYGDETNSFYYHDLRIEAFFPIGTPPSLHDDAHVTSLYNFVSKEVCPGTCTQQESGRCVQWSYAASRIDTGYPPRQAASNALVIYDLHGVWRTQYYDRAGRMLREVNFGAGETTDYNFSSAGYLQAVGFPSGERQCVESNDVGLPLQATRIPAP